MEPILRFQERPATARRLDSWKFIAGYVGKSQRTVQRWHSQFGLPIHRLGGDHGAIYAFTDELDEWMRSCGQTGGGIWRGSRSPAASLQTPKKLVAFPQHGDWVESSAALTPSMRLVFQAHSMWRNLTWSNLATVICLFREAVDLDAGNGEAYAGLAVATLVRSILGGIRAPAAYRTATAAIEQGLTCGPMSPALRTARAIMDILLHRNLLQAEQVFDGLLETHPSITQALGARSLARIASGDLKGAIRDLEQVSELNALSFSAIPVRAWCHYLSGQPRKAVYEIRQSSSAGRLGPFCDGVEALALIAQDCGDSHLEHLERLAAGTHDRDVLDGALGYIHARSGRTERARAALERLAPEGVLDTTHEPYAVALVHLSLGERCQAIARLQQAWDEGSVWSLAFRFDPILRSLEGEMEFEALLARTGNPVIAQPARPRILSEVQPANLLRECN